MIAHVTRPLVKMFLGVVLGSLASVAQSQEVILEDFEAIDAGSIAGQGGWSDSSAGTVVSGTAYEGDNYLLINERSYSASFTGELEGFTSQTATITMYLRGQTVDDSGGYNDAHARITFYLEPDRTDNDLVVNLCRAGPGLWSALPSSGSVGNDACIGGMGPAPMSDWTRLDIEVNLSEGLFRLRFGASDWSGIVDFGDPQLFFYSVAFQNVWSTGDSTDVDLISIFRDPEETPGAIPLWSIRPPRSWAGPVFTSDPVIDSTGSILIGFTEQGVSGPFYVSKLDQSGKEEWSVETASGVQYLSLGLDELLFVNAGKHLYAIESDGTVRWHLTSNDYFTFGAPAIGHDEVIYIGADGGLNALDGNTGAKLWTWTSPIGCAGKRPSIDLEGSVYFYGCENDLVAVNSQGDALWRLFLGGQTNVPPAIDSLGTIYVGSPRGLQSVSPQGTENWLFDTQDFAFPPIVAPNGELIFPAGIDDGNLYAVDISGQLQWKYPASSSNGYFRSPSVGADGTIYVTGFGEPLTAIAPDGTTKWTFPSRYGNAVLTRDGRLYAWRGDILTAFDITSGGLAETAWPTTAHDPQRTSRARELTEPKSYSITPASVTVDEDVGTVAFSVTRSDITLEEVLYSSTVQSYGFENNGDYVGKFDEPLYFNVGQAEQTVTIEIIDDNVAGEPDETFSLIVQAEPASPDVFLAMATFTIQDNDTGAYTLTPSHHQVVECDCPLSFVLSRSDSSESETLFMSTVQSYGSVNNRDYTPIFDRPVTFLAGEDTKEITVFVLDDLEADEGYETFGLIAQQDPGSLDYVASATFTIEDNDVVAPRGPGAPKTRIESVLPDPSVPGDVVTIRGRGFGSDGQLMFDGQPIRPLAWYETYIRFVTPRVVSGRHELLLQLVDGQGKTTIEVLSSQPSISAVVPTVATPGTTVIVEGHNFGIEQGDATIAVGGLESTVTYWSDKRLAVQVPVVGPGKHEIEISTPTGAAVSKLTVRSLLLLVERAECDPSFFDFYVGTCMVVVPEPVHPKQVAAGVSADIKLENIRRRWYVVEATGTTGVVLPADSTLLLAPAGRRRLDVRHLKDVVVPRGGSVFFVAGYGEPIPWIGYPLPVVLHAFDVLFIAVTGSPVPINEIDGLIFTLDSGAGPLAGFAASLTVALAERDAWGAVEALRGLPRAAADPAVLAALGALGLSKKEIDSLADVGRVGSLLSAITEEFIHLTSPEYDVFRVYAE